VAVLPLAPASLSGRNVCPAATQGCIAACLNLAGRGGLAKGGLLTHEDVATGARTNSVQKARVRRTEMLYNDRAGFLEALAGRGFGVVGGAANSAAISWARARFSATWDDPGGRWRGIGAAVGGRGSSSRR
ncbi:GP88 family protein, partial [Raoultella terrigena]|uniref:GP88 family protein n=1 Tax=Raoultella terrigena TaxID=577 RepID=UPI001C70A6EB